MKTDIEIAQEAKLADIREIAKRLGLSEDDISLYGKYKAKIPAQNQPKAKMILVTAINPTSAGEGKTTVSIGLADGLRRIGKNVCLALREPSLGPVFGIKGGAAGGGYAQVLPMEDINLHFTGDLHAITAANNLICAVVDNHLYFGNELGLKEIYFKRCMDMNDRSLRDIVIGRNRQGVERETGFDITAASEIMAILCLATDMEDLKKRIGNIIIGINEKGEYVYFRDFKAEGAVAALLKEAMNPNLVQTLEGTPAIVHGGPFANIAHGCNSIRATKTAMSLSDYTVTEAGFGADLGAEKFLDVKCRVAGIEPSCVVVVATVRALKLHGGALKENLGVEDLTALAAGIPNLAKHVENMVNVYRKPVVVAVNRFASDTQAEIALLTKAAEEMNVPVAFTDVFLKGGEGGMELAEKVVKECEKESKLCYSYQLDMPVQDKINAVVTRVYGGKGAEFSEVASRKIAELEAQGYGNLPVIIAKTQYSLSDDQTLLARPTDFTITVKDIVVKGGAGFIVAIAGKIMLMPGLSRHPAAERITVDADGKIDGLF
ncbi:MAG: formate--tetrahydrofolate ligase [Clostridiales bacterium]|nr:formate--tetrahydrofolate ligase [Clostridiales bacterium]